MALDHIPKAWRMIRVTFTGRDLEKLEESVKALRLLSLVSFRHQILETILDKSISDGVLDTSYVNRNGIMPNHQTGRKCKYKK